MSRSIWTRLEGERDGAHNDATVFFGDRGLVFDSLAARAPTADSFEELFRRHYAPIRTLLNGHTDPGLGVVVASPDDLEATAWFGAAEGEISPLIIGRHSAAEVFLPTDPGLSLRHLAVILHRRLGAAPVRYRVLDLRTPTAFADEEGRRVEAIEADSFLMIRSASFAILLLPTGGSASPWPENAEAAWKRIPERHYLESASADPDRWLVPGGRVRREVRVEPVVAAEQDRTLVHTFPGPVFPPRVLADSGDARGELLVTSPSGRVSLRLDAGAARQGVLLGRYERCDTAGLPVLSDAALSRVHLLVLEMGGELCAVDTASLNGTWVGSRRVRSARLDPGRALWLARDAVVEWRSFH